MKKMSRATLSLFLVALLSTFAVAPAQAVSSAQPAATASIGGTLNGSGMAGATFTAEIQSATGYYTAVGSPDGSYTLSNLPAGELFGLMFSGSRADGSSFMEWWGQDASHPSGNDSLTLAEGEAKAHVDQTIYRLTTLTVPVSCDGCDQFPFELYLNALDPSNNTWVDSFDRSMQIVDGSEVFISVYPGTYKISVHYRGAAGYDDPAPATVVVAEGQPATQAFTLTRTGTTTPGVSGGVGAFVNALYADILNRKAVASEITGWSRALGRTNDRGIVAEGFVDSDEYRMIRIDNAYRTILGRTPEPGGAEGWLDGMHRGIFATDDVEKNFLVSDEFFNKTDNGYPAWTAFYYWVSNVYKQVLGRTASGSEQFFWADMAQRRANAAVPHDFLLAHPGYVPPLDRGWVVNNIYDSVEAASTRVTAMYSHYLGRTPDANGVAVWAQSDIANGDAAVRSGLTASDEYYARALLRYPAR
ncbi:DUF4214 domain-containing protein [Subtercola sp. RTI3]|uniref:DUF4214 domain-containing protein n=1 Tax=Subtercola sp. RTI3 TaxID=3048639 RepID=UPI002B23B970|nr:DUF4214 domain-containing protein [Subtercola sp. RTI3]MEA9984062.1 hypothetical protein [Subtercola sp. RTI3]